MLQKRKGNAETCHKINKERKEKTLQSIRNAVKELISFGYKPSVKQIQNLTGLSYSAFQLPHIKNLLIELKIGKYGAKQTTKELENINIDDFLALEKKHTKQKEQIKLQKKTINSLLSSEENLKKENAILRMEIYTLKLFQDINTPSQRNSKNN
ncbi:hypothetical protein ALC152_19940 [Arcobacter sp. 15-2]|uniref:hypothetical protein n=1 Tax=Arcobacter sp. 15-2 TaxID=3374109 RepID=UPI00399D4571